jgi:hypothetical protein
MLRGTQHQQGLRSEAAQRGALPAGSLRSGSGSTHNRNHHRGFGSSRSVGVSLPRPDQARFPEHSTERDIRTEAHSAIPPAKGLFDPSNDKDACGVGFVAQLSKVRPKAAAQQRADSDQQTAGISWRLHSHTEVEQTPCNGSRVFPLLL